MPKFEHLPDMIIPWPGRQFWNQNFDDELDIQKNRELYQKEDEIMDATHIISSSRTFR
jgi:hypothetical protein